MPNSPARRDIVVIGGSSGFNPPLTKLLSGLPPDFPAAVLIALHMSPSASGMLATVASASQHLPVRQVDDGMRVELGTIYIATPDRHLLLFDGHLRLGQGPRENFSRPAIDALFRSAALCCGSRVIGVVLSGLLNDGAAGLHAIKCCGGMAVVQSPDDAVESDMPRSALDSTDVDHCVPGERLGAVLTAFAGTLAPDAPLPPADLALEVAIAAGDRMGSDIMRRLGTPQALTCPACGGVLTRIDGARPLRFRCQVGHAFTAEGLAQQQEGRVDEALRVAMRIIEERRELVARMAEDARQAGRSTIAEMYDARVRE